MLFVCGKGPGRTHTLLENRAARHASSRRRVGMSLVLAFDIERSGCRSEHHTIGIGVSIVDAEFTELESMFLPGYIEGHTNFEKQCMDQFWSKNPEVREKLRYTGQKTMEQRRRGTARGGQRQPRVRTAGS